MLGIVSVTAGGILAVEKPVRVDSFEGRLVLGHSRPLYRRLAPAPGLAATGPRGRIDSAAMPAPGPPGGTHGDVWTLHGTPEAESALELATGQDGEWSARMTLHGLVASTTVDAHRAAELGWQVSESRIGAPPSGPRGLVAFLAEHSSGWDDEETWLSRDGRLQLGFTHQGAGSVLLSAVLRQSFPSGWVAYGKFQLNAASLPALAEQAEQFLAGVAAR
ncbi:MAG: hypothetical protein NVSMB29_18210 [Candidatus Dormibacteria bacterium]